MDGLWVVILTGILSTGLILRVQSVLPAAALESPTTRCLPNEYGDSCTHCVPKDTCNDGHYTCDFTTGSKVCFPGWTGDSCRIKIDSDMTFVSCPDNQCRNGGSCVSGQCCCVDGFTGILCEIEIIECTNTSCINGGICRDLIGRYECLCREGYTGDQCDVSPVIGTTTPSRDTNCRPSSCLNNGTCFEDRFFTYCLCPTWYTGDRCETSLKPKTDSLNATVCPSNYYGDACDVFCIAKDSCLDGHYVCHEETGEKICLGGWIGDACDTRMLPQPLDPFCPTGLACKNDGQCNKGSCCCRRKYSGLLCQRESIGCLSSPCSNNGTCLESGGDFVCHCETGYTGKYCETVAYSYIDATVSSSIQELFTSMSSSNLYIHLSSILPGSAHFPDHSQSAKSTNEVTHDSTPSMSVTIASRALSSRLADAASNSFSFIPPSIVSSNQMLLSTTSSSQFSNLDTTSLLASNSGFESIFSSSQMLLSSYSTHELSSFDATSLSPTNSGLDSSEITSRPYLSEISAKNSTQSSIVNSNVEMTSSYTQGLSTEYAELSSNINVNIVTLDTEVLIDNTQITGQSDTLHMSETSLALASTSKTIILGNTIAESSTISTLGHTLSSALSLESGIYTEASTRSSELQSSYSGSSFQTVTATSSITRGRTKLPYSEDSLLYSKESSGHIVETILDNRVSRYSTSQSSVQIVSTSSTLHVSDYVTPMKDGLSSSYTEQQTSTVMREDSSVLMSTRPYTLEVLSSSDHIAEASSSTLIAVTPSSTSESNTHIASYTSLQTTDSSLSTIDTDISINSVSSSSSPIVMVTNSISHSPTPLLNTKTFPSPSSVGEASSILVYDSDISVTDSYTSTQIESVSPSFGLSLNSVSEAIKTTKTLGLSLTDSQIIATSSKLAFTILATHTLPSITTINEMLLSVNTSKDYSSASVILSGSTEVKTTSTDVRHTTYVSTPEISQTRPVILPTKPLPYGNSDLISLNSVASPTNGATSEDVPLVWWIILIIVLIIVLVGVSLVILAAIIIRKRRSDFRSLVRSPEAIVAFDKEHFSGRPEIANPTYEPDDDSDNDSVTHDIYVVNK